MLGYTEDYEDEAVDESIVVASRACLLILSIHQSMDLGGRDAVHHALSDGTQTFSYWS